MDSLFYDVGQVMEMLGVSKSKAYAIIQELNRELKDITFAGKVNRAYFREKIYGMKEESQTHEVVLR